MIAFSWILAASIPAYWGKRLEPDTQEKVSRGAGVQLVPGLWLNASADSGFA